MKKKLLFILTSLEGGGAEKVFIDMLRNFNYEKYKVTLLLVYGCGVYISKVPDEVEIITLFDRKQKQFDISIALYLRVLYHKFLERKFSKAIGNRKFDAIISYTEGYPLLMQSFINDDTVKRIAWVHTDMEAKHWCWWHFKSQQQETELYRKMDNIILVSKKAMDGFSRFFGLNDKLQVIYNVIDRKAIVELSKVTQIPKRKFTICHVGRLNPVKRQERIIQVAAELKRRGYDFEVWILGEGQCEADLKQMTSKLGLENVIKFLGFQDNPYPYMAKADIFLLTSDTEGYPTVVCESLCLGVPVVSTNITGSDELLGDGTGILTSFAPDDIANPIEKLMTEPNIYNHFVQMSKLKSIQFNPRDIISKVESLF